MKVVTYFIPHFKGGKGSLERYKCKMEKFR